MKKFFHKTLALLIILGATVLITMPGCEELFESLEDDSTSLLEQGLGYFANTTDKTNIEDDISYSALSGSTGSLPSKVDLRDKFPPIGDQGQYGTCVAWAVGYNLKTFIEGIDKNYSSSDLASASNQFSPKYLFWAISNSDKGADCNGTGFEPAFDVLLSDGCATLAEVPYDNLGDCSDATDASWDSNAANYKIDNYRQIEVTIEQLKKYLSEGRAIAFGARLGDNFMKWNSSAIISSDTYNNPGMQHAYHAMTLAGYDDTKNAFLVVNSWGDWWGDDGCIWVDYDFFVGNTGEFCFAAYVATNKRSNPDEDGDNQVDDEDLKTDKDLLSWDAIDKDDPDPQWDEWERLVTYNVFNSGNQTIYASDQWNILYIYYNAKDGEDYGILFYDEYTDQEGAVGEYGILDDGPAIQDYNNYWNNFDVPSGYSVSMAAGGSSDSYFEIPYRMPEITGEYYLVVIADGYDVIKEYDESNNYFFVTDENGEPLQIEDGLIQSTLPAAKKKTARGFIAPEKFAASPSPTTVTPANLNAYTPEEISTMIRYHYQTGEMQQKIQKYKKQQNYISRKRVKRIVK